MSYKHVMIDIETLGVETGSVISSIAAVKFSSTEIAEEKFYTKINLLSCEEIGMTCDTKTLFWWLNQPENCKAEFSDNEKAPNLFDTLCNFGEYCEGVENFWAKSPDFDCKMLEHAYKLYENYQSLVFSECPWKYWQLRDVRTAMALFNDGNKKPAEGAHNALVDATFQAEIIQQYLFILEMASGAAASEVK